MPDKQDYKEETPTLIGAPDNEPAPLTASLSLVSSDDGPNNETQEPQRPSCLKRDVSPHDSTHNMGIARDCKASWDSMYRPELSDCLRQCRACKLWVLKTDDLSEENLSKIWTEYEQKSAETPGADSRKKRNFRPPFPLGGQKLHRRADGTLTIGDCYAKRHPAPRTFILAFFWPLLLLGTISIVAPGVLSPFFNQPNAWLLYLVLLAWHVVGSFLVTRTTRFIWRLFSVVLFTLPTLIVPILGAIFIVELSH